MAVLNVVGWWWGGGYWGVMCLAVHHAPKASWYAPLRKVNVWIEEVSCVCVCACDNQDAQWTAFWIYVDTWSASGCVTAVRGPPPLWHLVNCDIFHSWGRVACQAYGWRRQRFCQVQRGPMTTFLLLLRLSHCSGCVVVFIVPLNNLVVKVLE